MPDQPNPHQAWQSDYEAVLRERDKQALWRRIEVAETAILIRLESLSPSDANHEQERQALAEAIFLLDMLKRKRLAFHQTGGCRSLVIAAQLRVRS